MLITGVQTNTTRHNYLYKYFQNTEPRFQFLTELSKARVMYGTDQPMSSHMNKASFFMQASCHAADKELVAGSEKCESRRGCLVGVPDIMACSCGCTFEMCPHVASGRMIS